MPRCRSNAGLHERFQINVGDTVRFDILGRIINARVSSIRDGRLARFRAVAASCSCSGPASLDDAPQFFIAPLKGPADVHARVQFQHDLVERYGNVSVIDFRDILITIRDVMSKVTLAISVVGGLVLFSGGLILIGAVAMTKFQRVYEAGGSSRPSAPPPAPSRGCCCSNTACSGSSPAPSDRSARWR